ncbi:MAG: hypothetical protein B7Z66_11595 [Chromatiales bacterium 21-64-14]|nr:MAG: hypothetical protein B7Z66_11595 [Chromatiales bacterium 21-64-14]
MPSASSTGKTPGACSGRLAGVEALRPLLGRREAIRERGAELAGLGARLEQAAARLQEIQQRLQRDRASRDALPETPSTQVLRQAIAAARKADDLDQAIRFAEDEIAAQHETCLTALARLPLWDGDLEAVPVLPLPSRERIHRFETVFDDIARRTEQLETHKQEIDDALQAALKALDALTRVGGVPTEAALAQARAERDALWQLLRRQWVEGEDVSAEAAAYQGLDRLPDAFEVHLAEADNLSDRLRREADRVFRLADLEAAEGGARRQTEALAEKVAAVAEERATLDAEWQAAWAEAGIDPLTPREMRAWLDDFDALRDGVARLARRRSELATLEQARARHGQRLAAVLAELGRAGDHLDVLEPVLQRAEATAEELDEIRRQRAALDQEITERETEIAALEVAHRAASEALERWREAWAHLVASLGLPPEASPTEADAFIEKLRALFGRQDEAEKLQLRIAAIDEDAGAFQEQVASLVARTAPELAGLPVDEAVVRLNGLLSENRSRQHRRQQLEEQIEQARQEIEESTRIITSMQARLTDLCAEAGCTEPGQLEAVEQRSAARMRAREALTAIERQILEAGEGMPLAELEAEAKTVDPDSLPARIAALDETIESELEPRQSALNEQKGRQKKELELMDGRDEAARLADQANALLARIRSQAERYVRVKLVGKILRDQIERYRSENQGPLVQRASEHFAALTRGAFEGLLTDFNDKDVPVLVGVRSGGEQVPVEGMSSGTRDQLYLALRLASLEKYMASAEPMPFIVDDVLVDFDDARSASALEALVTLAEKTQVILFTHHSRVVEQARALPQRQPVRVHEL